MILKNTYAFFLYIKTLSLLKDIMIVLELNFILKL